MNSQIAVVGEPPGLSAAAEFTLVRECRDARKAVYSVPDVKQVGVLPRL